MKSPFRSAWRYVWQVPLLATGLVVFTLGLVQVLHRPVMVQVEVIRLPADPAPVDPNILQIRTPQERQPARQET